MASQKSRKKQMATTETASAEAQLVTYKGFDRDLKCRNFAYEVGKTYTISGQIKCCNRGFHSVEMPLDAWSYYEPADSRYAETAAAGTIARRAKEDSKVASAEITIKAELTLPQFIQRAVDWIVARAEKNLATGDRGHAAATGDSGHAAATGDRGHAAATGYSGHAAATGYRGHAAATGDSGHAAATGVYGIAASLGIDATAKAGPDGWLVLAAWEWSDDRYHLRCVKSAKVGDPEGIKPHVSYCLNCDGTFAEVSS